MATITRFVPEDDAAIGPYLQVVLDTLERAVRPAIASEATKAQNDLDEVRTILRRIKWHLDGGDEASSYDDLAESIVRDDDLFGSPPGTVAAHAARADLDQAELQAILRETVPGAAQLTISSLKLVAGGRSKLTALFDQTGSDALPEKLVLRQDWASAVTGTSVASEYELLRELAPLGIRAPRCLHYVPGPNAIGAPFMIVSRLPGAPKGDIFQPPAAPGLAIQLAEQLALLHACPIDRFAGIAALGERDFTVDQRIITLAQLRRTHDALGQNLPTLRSAFDWLERHISTVGSGKALVHGDLGFHNFLVDGENLTAILDWELAHYGHPAEDLGYIRGDIERMLPWADFMAAYEQAGGPRVSGDDIDFYFVWGMTRLYCLLMQARAGISAGLVQDIAVVRVCIDSAPRLVAILADGLARIASNPSNGQDS